MKTLDLRALKCPAPVVETRKVLLAAPEEALSVQVGDTMARDNVSRLAATLGFRVETYENEGEFQIELTPEAQNTGVTKVSQPVMGKTVVYIGNDSMGGDNRDLGQKLMVSFIGTLLELEAAPDMAIFINEGVKLTTDGSPVLEPLQKLADRGTEIISCGLCLDFFHLKDGLKVGRVGNMFETVEAFSDAGKIIRP